MAAAANRVVKADIHDEAQAARILFLLNAYAMDPMGGGEPLSEYAQANLISTLRTQPTPSHIYLAYYGDEIEAVGVAICFQGFSTFKCKSLLNVHDFNVLASHRQLGIAKALLSKIEADCREAGFCKMTLEVLRDNKNAMSVYRSFGFEPYVLTAECGPAEFWQKLIL